MKKLKIKRFVIEDSRNCYRHGEYSNKYYAIKVAKDLSCSLKVHVVDTLGNVVVWG